VSQILKKYVLKRDRGNLTYDPLLMRVESQKTEFSAPPSLDTFFQSKKAVLQDQLTERRIFNVKL